MDTTVTHFDTRPQMMTAQSSSLCLLETLLSPVI